MLTDKQRLAICAAYFASSGVTDGFDSLAAWARQAGLTSELKHLLAALNGG